MPMSILSKAALVFASTLTLAASASATPLADAYARIKQASDHADLDALEQVVREVDASADKSADAALAASVADYRIASIGQVSRPRSQPRIEAAIARAEARLAPWNAAEADALPQPVHAEGLALLASTWGLHIAMDPAQTRALGVKTWQALRHAEMLAPDDARVQLALGIQLMYTPPLYGGDRRQALQAFERATALIAPAAASAVNWGLDDAWIWRGLALHALQQDTEAQAAFREASAVDPANGWARHLEESEGAASVGAN